MEYEKHFLKNFGMTTGELRAFCRDKMIYELQDAFPHYRNRESALRSALYSHGIIFQRNPNRKKKDAHRAEKCEMVRYLNKEYSYGAIAILLGVSRQAVEQMVKDNV